MTNTAAAAPFADTREADAYRVLHASGEAALVAHLGGERLGAEVADRLLTKWAETGAVRIKTLNPGRAPKSLVLMNATERAAWEAHVRANTGYVVRTFAKYAR